MSGELSWDNFTPREGYVEIDHGRLKHKIQWGAMALLLEEWGKVVQGQILAVSVPMDDRTTIRLELESFQVQIVGVGRIDFDVETEILACLVVDLVNVEKLFHWKMPREEPGRKWGSCPSCGGVVALKEERV